MDRSALLYSQGVSQLLTDNASLYLSTIEDPAADPEALFHKAASLHNLGRLRECLATLKSLLKIDKKSDRGLMLQANTLRRLNKFVEANEALEAYLRLSPEDSQAYYYKALNFEDLNQLDLAELALAKALVLRPNFPEARYKRGVLLALTSRKEEAVTEFSSAIAFNQKNEEYYFARGVCYWELRNLEAALQDFETALQLSPTFGEAVIWKCRVLDEMGQAEEAIQYLDYQLASVNNADESTMSGELGETFTQETVADFYLLRVRIYLGLLNYRKAVKLIDTDLVGKLKMKEGWFYLAVLSNQMGDPDTAMAHITKAISLDQNRATYYVFRAILFLENEKPKALNDIQRATQLSSKLFPDLYLPTEQQSQLHSLFEADVPSFVGTLDEIVNSICFLDMNFRRWIRNPTETEARFVPLVTKYKQVTAAVLGCVKGIFRVEMRADNGADVKSELTRYNEELFAMTQEYSILLSFSPQKQSLLALKLFWDTSAKEDPLVHEYIEVFYGTLVVYFHQLGQMKQETFQIPVDELAFEFPKFQSPERVGHFQLAVSLLCDRHGINRKYGTKIPFETVFESRAGDKKGHKLRLLLLEIAIRVATNEQKKTEITSKKLPEIQEAAWDSLRTFLKNNKKYDKIKKVVDTFPEKSAFLDAFFAAVFINSHPQEFGDSGVELTDRVALIILSGRHFESVKEQMTDTKRKSKLESLLSSF